MPLDSLWQDVTSARRSLRHRPLATASAIGMLALAVGLTVAMFTIVDSLILHPVPFPNAEQLALLRVTGKNGGPSAMRPAAIAAWRETHAFAFVEAVRSETMMLGDDRGEVTRTAAIVTPGIFQMLGGVQPVCGRLFGADDGLPGTDDRVLISEDIWRARYHADPAIVGRALTLDDRPVVVVGVLPASVRFPDWDTNVWRASTFDDPTGQSSERALVYARFSRGVPQADALRLATTAAARAGLAGSGTWVAADLLTAEGPDDYSAKALPLLSGGVVLLFLLLCANVGSLQLAGLTARRREFATRTALGAPRWRLVRQSFVESAAVGLGGVTTGVMLAWALISAARAVLPRAALLHTLNPLNLDGRALIVASAAGLIAIVVSGLVPAVVGTRVDVGRSSQLAGRSGTETRHARLATRTLLTSQIAISCMLLIGATALVRSFVNLVTADRGIDTSNIQVVWVAMVGPTLRTPDAREAAARAVEAQARALPRVTHAAWSYGTPPRGAIGLGNDWTPDSGSRVSLEVSQSVVGPQFFDLYRIPVVRGRSFEPSDTPDMVVVSERLARTLWPNVDPIGHSVRLDNSNARPVTHPVFRVIGVAKDTHFPSLRRNVDVPQLYTQYRNAINAPMLSLRCAGPCPDAGLVARKLAEAAPGLRVQDVTLLDDVYAAQVASPRAAASLAAAFAVAALVAAACGLFALLSDSVSRRRREFGIRTALGAGPADVRRLVWRDGGIVTLTGIGVGTIAGVVASRLMAAMMYQVAATDPVGWAMVAAVLLVTIGAAAWPPARSAALTAPATLLRDE